MNTTPKIVISVVAVALTTVSATYTAHADALVMAYVAAVSGAVGAYLLGLFQTKP